MREVFALNVFCGCDINKVIKLKKKKHSIMPLLSPILNVFCGCNIIPVEYDALTLNNFDYVSKNIYIYI